MLSPSLSTDVITPSSQYNGEVVTYHRVVAVLYQACIPRNSRTAQRSRTGAEGEPCHAIAASSWNMNMNQPSVRARRHAHCPKCAVAMPSQFDQIIHSRERQGSESVATQRRRSSPLCSTPSRLALAPPPPCNASSPADWHNRPTPRPFPGTHKSGSNDIYAVPELRWP
jgi:hypothetical protein